MDISIDQGGNSGQKHKFGSYPSEDWMHLLKVHVDREGRRDQKLRGISKLRVWWNEELTKKGENGETSEVEKN